MGLAPGPSGRGFVERRRPVNGLARNTLRGRTAVVILAAALGLGAVTGRFLLPAPSTATSNRPPSPPASSASHAALPVGTGPVTNQDLLAAADLEPVGISQHLYVQDRIGDGYYGNGDCTGQRTLGDTLAIGAQEVHFRGLMTKPTVSSSDPTLAADSASQVAREADGDAGGQALAENFAERLKLEEVPCQNEPPGHWVYGPTHTVDVAPEITAYWMGSYVGTSNTTGTAPAGTEPCGGFAVLQSGSHYGILDVSSCLDTAAMTRIVTVAATRL
jgi:hypothetical protein